MAEVKTLKFGEMILLEVGSRQRLYNETGVTEACGCYSGGSWRTFAVNSSGNLTRKTSGHPLTVAYSGSGSEVLDITHAIASPVVWEHSGTIHLWFGYDAAGGSNFEVYYSYSTDDGATWDTPVSVVAEGTGGSWNDEAVYPVGWVYNADDEADNGLYIVGYDGSAYRLGKWSVDGTVTSWIVSLANSANYTPNGSNPVGPPAADFGTRRVTVLEYEKRLHMICGGAAAPTEVYHATSPDGVTWDAHNQEVVLRRGATGSRDETSIHPSGSVLFEGNIYLYYIGFEGATSSPMIAVGSVPNHLTKTGTVESPVAYSSAPFSGDVSFEYKDDHIHIPDRGDPGVLRRGPFEPFTVSFSALFFGFGSGGVSSVGDVPAGSESFWKRAQLTSPVLGQSTGYTPEASFNALYRLMNSAGTLNEFYLFPECVAAPEFDESGDSVSVTIGLMCHGARHPIQGRY